MIDEGATLESNVRKIGTEGGGGGGEGSAADETVAVHISWSSMWPWPSQRSCFQSRFASIPRARISRTQKTIADNCSFSEVQATEVATASCAHHSTHRSFNTNRYSRYPLPQGMHFPGIHFFLFRKLEKFFVHSFFRSPEESPPRPPGLAAPRCVHDSAATRALVAARARLRTHRASTRAVHGSLPC